MRSEYTASASASAEHIHTLRGQNPHWIPTSQVPTARSLNRGTWYIMPACGTDQHQSICPYGHATPVHIVTYFRPYVCVRCVLRDPTWGAKALANT